MKKLFTAIMLVFITTVATAQGSLTKGNNQLNVGVGFSGWGIPVYIGFDHGISNDITLGAELSYRSYSENYRDDNYKHSIIGVSGNANYHFNRVLNIPRDFDFYAGLNLGFYSWSSPNGYNGSHTSGLGLAAQVGGRYFLSSKTGLNLEFGGGNAFSGGKFGLTIKL